VEGDRPEALRKIIEAAKGNAKIRHRRTHATIGQADGSVPAGRALGCLIRGSFTVKKVGEGCAPRRRMQHGLG
jgi:hypothetical protein